MYMYCDYWSKIWGKTRKHWMGFWPSSSFLILCKYLNFKYWWPWQNYTTTLVLVTDCELSDQLINRSDFQQTAANLKMKQKQYLSGSPTLKYTPTYCYIWLWENIVLNEFCFYRKFHNTSRASEICVKRIRVKRIRVKWIRVNQGVGVLYKF